MSGAVPDASLGDKLRRSLGLSLSNGYNRMTAKEKQEAEDDAFTDSGTFDGQEMAVLDSGHLRMLGLLARQNAAAAAAARSIKSDTSDASGTPTPAPRPLAQGAAPGGEAAVVLDPQQQRPATAFALCRELGAADKQVFTEARAAALLRLLQVAPEDCPELLRRNVFWPLLAACVERRHDAPEAVAVALQVVTLVLTHPPSRAVVTAQLLHRGRELVVSGLALLGPAALPAALELTLLSSNDSFLFVLVSRIAAEELPVTDMRLLAQCVVALAVRFRDRAKKAQLVALRRYAAGLMLQHRQPVELLALCKDCGFGATEARAHILSQLQAPHTRPLRAALNDIWRNGLTVPRLDEVERLCQKV